MIPSILITSAGTKAPLLDAATNAASGIKSNPKVIAADSNPDAVSQYFSDEFWCMKPLSSYTDDKLINELRARGIRFVLPSRDGELPRWSLIGRSFNQDLDIGTSMKTEFVN